jgi:NADPH:quinone reductase-like Zn-dependent oxidoreductase
VVHNQVNTKRSWDNRAFLEKRTFVINHYVMTMQDKKIVVAGGTSGIGLATAQRFKQLGGDVTVTGRNVEKVRAAEQQKLKAVVLDSRERPALDRFFAERGVGGAAWGGGGCDLFSGWQCLHDRTGYFL